MFMHLVFGPYLFSVDPQLALVGHIVLFLSTTPHSSYLIKRISSHSPVLPLFTKPTIAIVVAILECRRRCRIVLPPILLCRIALNCQTGTLRLIGCFKKLVFSPVPSLEVDFQLPRPLIRLSEELQALHQVGRTFT